VIEGEEVEEVEETLGEIEDGDDHPEPEPGLVIRLVWTGHCRLQRTIKKLG